MSGVRILSRTLNKVLETLGFQGFFFCQIEKEKGCDFFHAKEQGEMSLVSSYQCCYTVELGGVYL